MMLTRSQGQCDKWQHGSVESWAPLEYVDVWWTLWAQWALLGGQCIHAVGTIPCGNGGYCTNGRGFSPGGCAVALSSPHPCALMTFVHVSHNLDSLMCFHHICDHRNCGALPQQALCGTTTHPVGDHHTVLRNQH